MSSIAVARPASPRWQPVAVAVAAAVCVASLGGLATDIGPWYAALRKPSWQPPNWLFGPAWTTIYTLVVIAGLRGWHGARHVARGAGRAAPGPDDAVRADSALSRRALLALLAGNASVNLLWSVLFFQLQRPDWALLDVGVLWSSVLALVIAVGRVDRVGAALLCPYLAWVSFASLLNATIVALNAPFPGR